MFGFEGRNKKKKTSRGLIGLKFTCIPKKLCHIVGVAAIFFCRQHRMGISLLLFFSTYFFWRISQTFSTSVVFSITVLKGNGNFLFL